MLRGGGVKILSHSVLLCLTLCLLSNNVVDGVQDNGSTSGAGSPHDQGLRPAESWLSALLPEATDALLDPPLYERDENRLLAILGNDYDAEFMSNSKPNATSRLSWEFPFHADIRGRLIPTGEMPRALQTLHLG